MYSQNDTVDNCSYIGVFEPKGYDVLTYYLFVA